MPGILEKVMRGNPSEPCPTLASVLTMVRSAGEETNGILAEQNERYDTLQDEQLAAIGKQVHVPFLVVGALDGEPRSAVAALDQWDALPAIERSAWREWLRQHCAEDLEF